MREIRKSSDPLLILIPLLLTFVTQRVILHHSHPDTHVFVGGYLVHHLFSGVLILIPTAFLLAFGLQSPRKRNVALMILGFSSAMVLDEVIYLICTDGSGVAYRGRVSLWGAVALEAAAAGFLVLAHFRLRRCSEKSTIREAPAE